MNSTFTAEESMSISCASPLAGLESKDYQKVMGYFITSEKICKKADVN
ncbi:919_t:CDS:2 [Paraglomus occultum]|uniref:919_t:CDS:1 n=1 Tax=Paraglomus occultum TaxID=144539 RepID=A0A9N9AU37_9GLOM|nr:919_t:CDS:2 [Paraglomus occultum]